MPSLYDYFDYQAFLRDYFDARKKDQLWFSFRYLASKIMMDHSNLIKVLLGKRHISRRNALAIADFLKFTAKEKEYFTTLVEFNKAKSEAKSKHLLEKLLTIKNVGLKKIEPHQYDYYREWYHTAIYSLLDYYEFPRRLQGAGRGAEPSHHSAKGQRVHRSARKIAIDTQGCGRTLCPNPENGHLGAELALFGNSEIPGRDYKTRTAFAGASPQECPGLLHAHHGAFKIRYGGHPGNHRTIQKINYQGYP